MDLLLSDEDRQRLIELQPWAELFNSPVWMQLRILMAREVSKAHQAMIENVSDDPMSYMRLQERWRQRKLMVDYIVGHVESSVEIRKQIVEDANEYA